MLYIDEDDLESKITSLLRKHNIKYRSLAFDDDRIIIGIEGTRSDYPSIIRKLKQLKLQPINLVYGRWVFEANL